MKIVRFVFLFCILSQSVSAQISQTALYFDGTSGYVSLPQLPFFTTLGTNPFTLEAWIRYDDTTTTQSTEATIFSTRDEAGGSQGFRIGIHDGSLVFWSGVGGWGSSTNLRDGLCHHIAYVREPAASGYIKGYLDGVQFSSFYSTDDISSSILPTIGRSNAPIYFSPFKGLIKEMRVWSTVRSQSEIQSNANVVIPGNSPGLVHYWRFNEGVSNIVNDHALGGGGLGFISGSTLWTTGCFGCVAPAAVISYNSPLTFCLGGNVVLNATTGLGYTYVWRKDNVITFNTGSSVTVTSSGIYTVQITNLCGISTSNPVTVNVISPPTSNISPSGAQTRCNSIILQANAGAGFIYQWKKNGTNISGATSFSYTATTTGNYSFSISNSCTTRTSPSVAVTIVTSVPSTPGTISVSGGNSKVCPGETRTYSISSIGNATSYTWTAPLGSVIQSGQGTTSVVILYNSGYTVTDTLRVKANNVCGSSTIRKLTIVRNNPAKPDAITGANYGLCNVSNIPYSVTNVAGITYNWSFSVPNTQVVSGQGSNAIVANYTSGFLSGILNVTAANGCGVSAARTLSVYAKPATPVSVTGPSQVCVNQQNVPYSMTPLFGTATYTWTSPTGATVSNGTLTANTITSTATSVLVDFAATAGNVRVRGNNNCASGSYRSLAVTFNCREAVDLDDEEPIKIYPNPFDDALVVDGTGFEEVRIFDSQGRLVFHSVLNESKQTLKPGLQNGAYMITLISKSETKTYRVVRIGNSE